MKISYESFCNKINKIGGDKCKNVVLAKYNDKMLVIALFIIFFTYYSLNMVIFSGYRWFFLVLYIVVIIWILFMLFSRKIGFGMANDKFIYVKFNHLGYKEKEFFNIPFENIRYLDVKKRFGSVMIRMSLIDHTGKFRRLNISFAPMVFGFSVTEQKYSGFEIYNKLMEIQKVLDRGDF